MPVSGDDRIPPQKSEAGRRARFFLCPSAVIAFRILRSGQVTDVKIEVPSGIPVYDRAATRSVYAANPLPPLPPEYRGDALGVHIRFQ